MFKISSNFCIAYQLKYVHGQMCIVNTKELKVDNKKIEISSNITNLMFVWSIRDSFGNLFFISNRTACVCCEFSLKYDEQELTEKNNYSLVNGRFIY